MSRVLRYALAFLLSFAPVDNNNDGKLQLSELFSKPRVALAAAELLQKRDRKPNRNNVWKTLVEICGQRAISMEQMIYWQDYRDQSTGSTRARILKELRQRGHLTTDIAAVFRLSSRGVRNMISKV